MATPVIVIRNVTSEECPWLDRDYLLGELLYVCERPTYGCVNEDIGFPATHDEGGDYPFFEFPLDAAINIEEFVRLHK